jgi:formylmethanofuran dehydrogenase subunit E
MNTWPKGYRHAMDQVEHEAWNSRNYPGTRQLCSKCDEPTGHCEEDSMYIDEEPVCVTCWQEAGKPE